MTRFLVAVVNGATARFLTLEPLEAPELESGPDLIERCDLVNPAFEMAGQELWANTKTGRNRGGGKGHNYDDHRGNHLVEFERRFAQGIVAEIEQLIRELELNSLILVAEPQVLGILRDCLQSTSALSSVAMGELAKDLCWMKPRQLHDYLAQKDILPGRQIAVADIRARR